MLVNGYHHQSLTLSLLAFATRVVPISPLAVHLARLHLAFTLQSTPNFLQPDVVKDHLDNSD